MINEYFNKKIHQNTNYKNNNNNSKTIYWGEVICVGDKYGGGSLKVRIADLDSHISDENLSDAYPLLPKFFHIYPQKGEIVRVVITDTRYPQKGRLWIGNVISQLQNIKYDGIYSALSTTDLGVLQPEKSLDMYPDADGVFPQMNDIALIGRDNVDIILKEKKVELRVGKHYADNIFKYNKENIGLFRLSFNRIDSKGNNISEAFLFSDKIALISHKGNPNIKEYDINEGNIEKIYDNLHPSTRGDILVEQLEIIRKTLIEHVHPYNALPADRSNSIIELQKLDFNKILQKNIMIN